MLYVPTSGSPPQIVQEGDQFKLKLGDRVVEIPKLKHGVLFVTVSNIVTQCAYCEYKLHLDYMRGRRLSKAIERGVLEHERHLGRDAHTVDVDINPKPEEGVSPVLINVGEDGLVYFNSVMSRKWLFQLLDRDLKAQTIIEPVMLALVDNIPLLAQPDVIHVRNGKIYVIELKTTSRKVLQFKPVEILQAKIYAAFLKYAGFDNTVTVLVKARQGCTMVLRESIDKIVEHVEKGSRTTRLGRDVIVTKLDTDETVLQQIFYALEYWTHKRNPKPSPNVNKCRTCPHAKTCPFRPVMLR